MFRIVDIDIRVAEVQLESSAQVWVFRATCDLFDCIRPKRIYTAKPKQPIRVLGNLRARPIVLGHDLCVFIGNRWFVWIREAIRNREYDRSLNSGSVELRN